MYQEFKQVMSELRVFENIKLYDFLERGIRRTMDLSTEKDDKRFDILRRKENEREDLSIRICVEQ